MKEQISNQNPEEPNNSRRKFLKNLAIGGAGFLAGLGSPARELGLSELEGNKKREGNAVTVTLKNGKKVSLVLGAHLDEFVDGQIAPESDLLALESTGDINKNFSTSVLDSLGAVQPEYIESRNNTPVIREMLKNKKPLYYCDISSKKKYPKYDFIKQKKLGIPYSILAVSLLLPSFDKDISRRNFLSTAIASLSIGLSTRSIATYTEPNWKHEIETGFSPEELTPNFLLMEKYSELEKNSILGSTILNLTEEEKWKIEQIIALVRSIIMALKLRSTLRLSQKNSVTMTMGARHILVEDFVDMDEEILIKKLIPFKDGLKEYFNIDDIYELSRVYYDTDKKFKIGKETDLLLKDLVEKYLLK